MDLEKSSSLINEFNVLFEKTHTKDVYEKCIVEIITERHNIISKEEYDKNLIDKIDKVIESIYIYLISVAS